MEKINQIIDETFENYEKSYEMGKHFFLEDLRDEKLNKKSTLSEWIFLLPFLPSRIFFISS